MGWNSAFTLQRGHSDIVRRFGIGPLLPWQRSVYRATLARRLPTTIPTILRPLATSFFHTSSSRSYTTNMAILSKFGYETIPASVTSKTFYDLRPALPGKDKTYDFSQLKGKAVLIVNTASKCGFTPQYTGLEKIYEEYKDQGLEVLGFPSDEFGGQEPLDDEGIASFCQLNHGVTFPLMQKGHVNGSNMNEVFAWLKAKSKGTKSAGVAGTTSIKWNFTKFLVDRQGNVVGRYAPTTKPEALKADIEAALAGSK